MECLVKPSVIRMMGVWYFCFHVCLMEKCTSNVDGKGDDKEEMQNGRQNSFEILLLSFPLSCYVLFGKSLLISKEKGNNRY